MCADLKIIQLLCTIEFAVEKATPQALNMYTVISFPGNCYFEI